MSFIESATPFISLIICAYNPNKEYFTKVLDAIKKQDLNAESWELLLIDNNSSERLSKVYNINWQPNGRHFLEANQGLAHARRRGYLESRGDLIIHCDDDTIFDPSYLRTAKQVYLDRPFIGTFGGQLTPDFEVFPRSEEERRFGEERLIERDVWSNIIDDTRTMPWGGGMCLRREVIVEYLRQVESDPRRLILGRSGNRMLTGEDLDLNYVATRQGYATGLFKDLHLTHYIPKSKMSSEHYIRYKGEGNAYSVTILKYLHFNKVDVTRRSALDAFFRGVRLWTRTSHLNRSLAIAWERGRGKAIKDMRKWGWLA